MLQGHLPSCATCDVVVSVKKIFSRNDAAVQRNNWLREFRQQVACVRGKIHLAEFLVVLNEEKDFRVGSGAEMGDLRILLIATS